ncbi:MAG: hypothetical protein KKH99_04130 [Proteobacteria bacterium]|nr:hypothetical protein [Pseudomonadota bacterium]
MNLLTAPIEIFKKFNSEKRKTRILPNGVLLMFAFLPLVWGVVLSAFVISQETPGFRLDVTQDYFVVSKINKQINFISEEDCIIKISGMDYNFVLGSFFKFNEKISTPQTLTIKKNGAKKTIAYQTVPITLADYFKGVWLSFLFVVIITFLVVAAILKSPVEQPADLVLIALTLFSLLIVNEIPYYFGLLNPKFLSFSFLIIDLIHWLAFSAWAHFVFQFPVERQLLTGKPLITAALYILPPAVALGISGIVSSSSGNFWGVLQHYRYWATPWIIVGTLLKHFIDYYKIKSPLAKSQLKLMMCGGFVGIAPYFFLYLLPNMFFDHPIITFHVVTLFGLLIPLTIFLAIIRYNLMDVDQLISKSLTYIILILSMILLYSGFIVFFKQWLWGKGLLSQEISIIFILFIALVFNPLKTRLQSRIDCIFLKDPMNYGLLLLDFSNRIVKSIQFSSLVELLTTNFSEEFRIQKSVLLISDNKTIQVYPEEPYMMNQVQTQRMLINALQGKTKYLCAYDMDHSDSEHSDIIKIMDTMQCPVIYGIDVSENFFGVLLLGNKKNGKTYSRTEIHLFTTLINNVSIAMKNSLMYESLNESKKQLETMFDQKVQSEKMAAIGEMTSIIAHELKNPLGIIHSSAQYLSEGKRSKVITLEMLNYIKTEVEHLNLSINSILNLAKQKAPEFMRVDLSRQIHQLVDQWLLSKDHRTNVRITVKIGEPMPSIYADFKQLSQVLLNLIRNSEEMIDAGGEITLDIIQENDFIQIHVIDNGPGIPDMNLDKVFQNFFTTKKQGLGLGLVVCRQIINAHNGFISLANRPQSGGAIASIRLPIKPLATIGRSNLQEAVISA